MFIRLLSTCTIESLGESFVSNLKRTIKYVSLNNQQFKARATLVNINSDETLFLPFPFKDAFYGLRQFFITESPLKMMKKAFYFTLKALFVLKMFKFFSWLSSYVEKTARLER